MRSTVGSPVSYRMRLLWRLDAGGAWRLIAPPGPVLYARTLETLGAAFPLGLEEGYYFAVATVASHTECDSFRVSEKRCADVMLGWPSPRGQVAVCLPGGRASFVPDPLELTPSRRTEGPRRLRRRRGLLSGESTRRDGVLNGPAKRFDVNGRLVWSGTHRDGKLSGMVTELKGGTRFETPYVDGKAQGTQKGFDAAGRLTEKCEFVAGACTAQETYHPNGAVASRTTRKGSEGWEIRYSLTGAKVEEARVVITAQGAARQCTALYDGAGRAHPCSGGKPLHPSPCESPGRSREAGAPSGARVADRVPRGARPTPPQSR